MLRITGKADMPQASLEIDPHVPFILRLGVRPEAGNSLRWYFGEGDESRLEIWLDENTGAIHRVSLVWVSKRHVSVLDEADKGPNVPSAGRTPVCDKTDWAQAADSIGQISASGEFRLTLGRDYASIRFPGAGEAKEWIINHRSRFGIDSKQRLSSIDLIGLKSDEAARLRDSVESSAPR